VAPSLVTQLNSFLYRKILGRPPIIVSVFFTVINVYIAMFFLIIFSSFRLHICGTDDVVIQKIHSEP